MSEERLSVTQAIKVLGLGRLSIYKLCQERKIRHYRLGEKRGRIMFDPKDLDAYLESCAVEVEPAGDEGVPGLKHLSLPGRPRRV